MNNAQTKSVVSFLPLEPAAMRLGLPVTFLRRLADAGDIPYIQAGKRRLFNCDDVAAALRDSYVERRAAK